MERTGQAYLPRLNAVSKYIEAHATKDISVEEIAGIAHFSRSHVSRIFTRFTGLSFGHYLNRKAKRPCLTLTFP